MARRCGIGDNAEPLIERILARTAHALAQVESEIPAAFPGQVAEKILTGLKTSLKRLEAMPVN
jgi:serine/threonine-protein kinase HipA